MGHLPDAPPAGEPGIDLATGGTIAFGDADCGTTPAPRTLTFKNTGTAPLSWSATIEGDGFAIAGGAAGEVAPGESAAISIAPELIPSTAVIGQSIVAMLVVESNASDNAIAVQLAVTPHGGSLHIATPAIGFGQAQLTETLSQDLEITNTGDRAIQLALGAPSNPDFTDAWTGAPAPGEIAPSASLDGAIAHFRPTTAAVENAVIAIAATGPVCAGDAPEIAVTGEGTTAQVTVAPGTIQFGTTACGATATARQVTITNRYHFAVHYTAAVASGPYTIAAAQQTGTIAADSTATITVRASAVPASAASLAPNALAGTMTVTTDAPGATPANLTMAQGARGAVLALTPNPGTTIAFGNVAAGTPASRSYSMKNTGNVGAAVSAAVTGSGFSATTPGGGTVPANGADTAATVTQTVAQRGSLTGTLAVSTTTALCQSAAPGALNLTATGRAAVAGIGGAPAMIAMCGAGTPASVNIAVANTGEEPLVISSATATGGFVVTSSIPLTVPAGASRNLAVRPPAAAVGTDPAGTVKTGMLSLATNEIGNPTRAVSLSSTVTGAALAVTPAPGSTIAFGNVNAGSPASQSYSVRNTGNLAATVSIATTGPGFSATRPNGGTIPANGTNQNAAVSQTVAQHGAVTGTLTVSSSTAQCTAAPAAVNLTAFGRTPTAIIGTVPAMSVACGSGTPGIVSVSVQNTGDAPLVLSASASGGFVITSAASMTIAAGASSAITLRPPASVIGSDLGGTTKSGMLTITTNEVTGATHQIPLASTVVGANLFLRNAAGAPITNASFTADMACPASQAIFVTNTGNADAQVFITTPNFQLFRFDDFAPSSSVPAGTSVSYMMRVWTVLNACAGNQQIEYSATGTLCTALPLTLQASFNITGQTSCFCT